MSVIKHYEFRATLNLRTQLPILSRHGGTHPSPLQTFPLIGSAADGQWAAVTKSWGELAGPNARPKLLKRLNQLIQISQDRVRARLKAIGASAKQLEKVKGSLGREMMASDICLVPLDGGEYLPSLKAF